MKILIVEDDKWYAESLKNLLRPRSVALADSPETAIVQLDEFQPDLILLDFQLGARNALVLLNELQSYTDSRNIPVVILATDGRRLDQADFQQYGVLKILDKAEITPQQLIKELDNVQ
jgi:CheY-like chemotaxis protein